MQKSANLGQNTQLTHKKPPRGGCTQATARPSINETARQKTAKRWQPWERTQHTTTNEKIDLKQKNANTCGNQTLGTNAHDKYQLTTSKKSKNLCLRTHTMTTCKQDVAPLAKRRKRKRNDRANPRHDDHHDNTQTQRRHDNQKRGMQKRQHSNHAM